jgi:hypothetical protein
MAPGRASDRPRRVPVARARRRVAFPGVRRGLVRQVVVAVRPAQRLVAHPVRVVVLLVQLRERRRVAHLGRAAVRPVAPRVLRPVAVPVVLPVAVSPVVRPRAPRRERLRRAELLLACPAVSRAVPRVAAVRHLPVIWRAASPSTAATPATARTRSGA